MNIQTITRIVGTDANLSIEGRNAEGRGLAVEFSPAPEWLVTERVNVLDPVSHSDGSITIAQADKAKASRCVVSVKANVKTLPCVEYPSIPNDLPYVQFTDTKTLEWVPSYVPQGINIVSK